MTECNCHVRENNEREDAALRALNRIMKIAKSAKSSSAAVLDWPTYELADAILTVVDEEFFRG